MVCIYCASKTEVTNSRHQKRTNSIWRRRKCTACKAIVTTVEALDYTASVVVKEPSGTLEAFSRDKLLISLHRSLSHRKTALTDATALTDTIVGRLHLAFIDNTVDRQYLRLLARETLERFDHAAGVHYTAFHPGG